MSVQNVMTFVNKLEGNTELQNQIKSLTPGNPAAVVKLAAGLGFDFSIQELQDVVAQASELTEEQLDQVAGGIIAVKPPPGTNAILVGLLVPAVMPPTNFIVGPAVSH